MRDLSDPVLRRGSRADAEREAKRLQPVARRMGYRVVVLPTRRRYGRYVYQQAPYCLFLVALP